MGYQTTNVRCGASRVFVDYDTNKDLVDQFKVKTIPDSLIIEDNTVVRRKVGYPGFQAYKKWLDNE